MMKRLIRTKRAVSPIITTVFLMGIMIGAIAFTLGIIYPNLEELNDQFDLEGNSTNLVTLDQNLRTLMLSGREGRLYLNMELGDTGFLMGDNKSSTIIILKYKTFDANTNALIEDITIPTSPSQFNEIQYRLMIRQKVQSDDFFPKNTYSYLTGGATQNLFYLNATFRASMPWTILNQSRFQDDFVFTQLGYRNIITTEKVVSDQNLNVNVTIVIQRVKFIWDHDLNDTSSRILVEAIYDGTDVTTYDWVKINNAGLNSRTFYLQTVTSLWDATSITGNLVKIEQPYSQEVPDSGSLNIRLQFIDHLIHFVY